MNTTTATLPSVGKSFLLAGRAICTLTAPAGRWTYQITLKDDGDRPPIYFVSVLTGPGNLWDYTYLGVLDAKTGDVRLTRKSHFPPSAPAVVHLRVAFVLLWRTGRLPEEFALHHEGRCGRCGRTLTVPESIATGLGPECATKGAGA